VKLLVDICLSPRLAKGLCALGHDAVHAADFGLHGAGDEAILVAAAAEDRVVLSADTDFGTILARTHASAPSVILIRRAEGRRVDELLALLAANLATLETAVDEGSVVVLGESTIRIRRLPIL
jgi:predicted nuclease of predicted toxin-antitoxin system